MNRRSILSMVFLGTLALGGRTNCVIASAEDPPFRITTKRDDDKIEAKAVGGKARFSVQSPSGISQAVIERTGNEWPHVVTFQLHVKGLENLKVTNGKETLEAAISSHDGKMRLWMDGKEDSPLDSKSPYWMEIRRVRKDDKPGQAVPLTDGYFEMRLPKVLLEDSPKSITVSWIDFYR